MRRKKDRSNGITALYERLSRDDDNAGESNSIVHQKQMLEDYAMKHGFTNLVHFTDDGWSGATFDRPSWNKLVEGVKNGEITACICKDMSRIGRDHLQVGFFTDILFREKEVRFIAINNGIDSDRQETSEFAPFLNIMNKIPYETHPADRKRQCVFGGSSNTLDFLPLDRTGNRRFVPVMVYPERAEVHILADEQASREYINQMWAEAMEIYRSGNFRLRFSPAMNDYLKAHQKDFMPEDTKAGQILDYLERYSGSMVCSKQLYKEALGHDYDEPKQWELREINDIMNNAVTGWMAFSNPRYFPEPYRRQKGWERIRNDNEPDNSMDGFQEIPTEEMEQLGLPEEWLKQK